MGELCGQPRPVLGSWLLTYDLVALAAEPARSWKTFWLVGQEYTGWMVALEEVRMPSSSQLVS
jgi:hypothetical protein